jgi:formylglycine-generating enzyme required for sulfatase activity
MALVPGGSFQRAGTPAPKELVDLCVDVLETTVTEYEECVAAGRCTTDGVNCSAQSTWGKDGKESHPIVCLVFEQAEAYCSFRDKRLPSTEEWEWAARGGDEGRTYPWGNEEPGAQLCWTGKKRQSETCPVGSYPEGASKHGLANMGGNVLEFTTSDADPSSPVRIARGGAWNAGDPALIRNGRLGGFKLDYRCGFLGIRCAKPAAPASDEGKKQ